MVYARFLWLFKIKCASKIQPTKVFNNLKKVLQKKPENQYIGHLQPLNDCKLSKIPQFITRWQVLLLAPFSINQANFVLPTIINFGKVRRKFIFDYIIIWNDDINYNIVFECINLPFFKKTHPRVGFVFIIFFIWNDDIFNLVGVVINLLQKLERKVGLWLYQNNQFETSLYANGSKLNPFLYSKPVCDVYLLDSNTYHHVK